MTFRRREHLRRKFLPESMTFPPATHRQVAIALPARDEEKELPACLAALDQAAAAHAGPVTVLVAANECRDRTVEVLEQTHLRHARLRWIAVSLLPGCRHAGWARRIAFDEAAALLPFPTDVLMSTDADTAVAPNWIARTIAHLDDGVEAVAGRALTRRTDRAALGPAAARRLNLLGRYYTALDWLRADQAPDPADAWPRHHYEGGASIALTLDLYRRIGGAPTPPIAEDRALFAAVRAAGGRVRHPLDVRVFTSSRLDGRAPGGMADAFARWIAQHEDDPLHETYVFPAALDPARATAADRLSFRMLPHAITTAAATIRARRSASAPQIQPVVFEALRPPHLDVAVEQQAEAANGLVAGQRIIGLPRPVDEEQEAA